MSQFIFVILLFVATVIRLPLSFVVVVIRPLVPFIKKRLDFERKNFLEENCRSFKKDSMKADYCFLVSSEGELEQSRALIYAALEKGKKVELVYTSESVEKKCQELGETYKDQIRSWRLPLLSASPFNVLYFQSVWEWVSAPVVIFCRYDFFPELLTLKIFKKKLVLVSGATKNLTWYKKESFKFFDVIVAATVEEKEAFASLLGGHQSLRLFACDFRVPRIAERIAKSQTALAKKASLQSYFHFLEKLSGKEKLIFGSAWPSDLFLLNDPKLIEAVKTGRLYITLAPHKLSDEFVATLKERCQQIFGNSLVEVVNELTPYQQSPVVILQVGGLLCELYSLFKIVYVGGGYERSIHSVLEPFVAGAAVIVGPIIHRSTELILAKSYAPHEIHVLKEGDSLYTVKETIDVAHLDQGARQRLKEESEREMQAVMAELLG